MSKPLFADSWYDTPRVTELRQEIQNIYQLLREIQGILDDLEERLTALEP